MHRRRVLVVDDDDTNRELLCEVLSALGYAPETASEGHEAVERTSQCRYALVLMDCQMPGMDGFQATVEIRRREGDRLHTPIIALTAMGPEIRERALAVGMDDYCGKPFDLATLERLLVCWTGADVARAIA